LHGQTYLALLHLGHLIILLSHSNVFAPLME
jgi:hypothetical protein